MFEKEAEEYAKKLLNPSLEYAFKDGAEFGYNKVKEELEEEKKLNAEIKARFVKCNTCTDDMKSKSLMFTENLCEGERCEELIDIVSLVNKSDLERKIEALEKANEWHYVKDGDFPKENQECYFICSNIYDEHNKVSFAKSNINVRTGIYTFFLDDEGNQTTDPCFYDDVIGDEWDLSEVYAWKETVLPELKESE